jgi:hypothetical protein
VCSCRLTVYQVPQRALDSAGALVGFCTGVVAVETASGVVMCTDSNGPPGGLKL